MNAKNIIQPINFKKQYPYCFKEYQKMNGETYTNLNSALDSLLFKFGIGIVLQQVYSDNEKFIGYKSFIKFYPQNKIGEECGQIRYIEDSKKFKVAEKATKVTTIKALEILEDAFIFGRIKS